MNYDYLDKTGQEDLTLKKLRGVMPLFYRIDFYNKKLSDFDLNSFDLKEFKKLPFTYKNELRESHALNRTIAAQKDIAFFFTSSGTTGHPTSYVWTTEDNEVLNTVAKRAMNRIGVTLNDLSLIIAPFGMPIMWYCMMTQYATVNAGVIPLGIADPNYILNAINEFSPTIITTVPNSLLSLLDYKENHYQNDLSTSIRQIHVAGDFLSNSRRVRIEERWNAECYDFYGLSEILGPIAGECVHKNGMHFISDYVYLEIIDPITKREVNEGEVGVAVYTTLWNKGAPLLRYWSDDFVSINSSQCQCARKSPRIYYKGRKKDSFLLHDKLIFAKDIEEEIFKFNDVGNEWQMHVSNTDKGVSTSLEIEVINENDKDINGKLSKRLSEMLGQCVDVNCVRNGHFSRKDVKPHRIVYRDE